jgi:hypothetical protein
MEQARGGGRSRFVKVETCEPVPAPGTYKRASDGQAVDPPMPWDFPLVAECLECHETISRKRPIYSDWQHAE